jgi:endonuclease YncB( thermonuclease family)
VRHLIAFILVVVSAAGYAATLTGKVVAVADGDTITVLDAQKKQHKIRLAGIAGPEKGQAFGNRSKQHLSYLLYDKSVAVEWKKYDRYGRIVGKVMVAAPNSCPPVQPDCPKMLDVGLAQISDGLAWHYKQYAKEQTPEDRKRYAAAERAARLKRVGLWRDKHPVPPWEWRRGIQR